MTDYWTYVTNGLVGLVFVVGIVLLSWAFTECAEGDGPSRKTWAAFIGGPILCVLTGAYLATL